VGGHRAGHACDRACRCNRAKQSYLVIEIFVGASLLPTPDRMGAALRLTIGLDPGPMMARHRCLPLRKIVVSLTDTNIQVDRPAAARLKFKKVGATTIARG
jgi:hypothetical protein